MRDGGSSFNEAEAFTPRIGEAGKEDEMNPLPSFNEAEAFTPRIGALNEGPIPAEIRASMRPRLLHLGYRAAHGRGGLACDGFNEAEAFTPRIPTIASGCSAMSARLQ